jgi:hypothetical protein
MITINLKQVRELLRCFDGEDETEIAVAYFDDMQYMDDGVEVTAPAGLYAYDAEYPEEGAIYLGDENE